MSELLAEPATRVRLSDPVPSRCSACLSAPSEGVRFVDFQAAFDAGAVLDEGTMAVRDSIDELHLCESCVRQAAERLGFKPELHRRQAAEIRRLELRGDHWEAYAKRVEATLQERPEPAPRARRSR